MTREHVKEILPIIQAYAEGKAIQIKSHNGHWIDGIYRDDLAFDSPPDQYRIKPEPRECWQVHLKGSNPTWDSRERAEKALQNLLKCEMRHPPDYEIIHFREVL